MTSDNILEYKVSDHVAEIVLNRPPVNAMSIPLLEQLIKALKSAAGDDNVRAVLITSALTSRFSAGIDLNLVLGSSAEDVRRLLDKLYIELTDVQYNLGKPSIAVVNGAARGGGMTLSISCDVILAGESATFGYPEIDLAVIPAIHFVHLPRIIGRHRAFELLFSGRTFSAEEAASLGLVSRVVKDDKLMDEAKNLAETFASKSPNTMRLARAAFMSANDLDYRRGVGYAAELFCNVVATDDAQEGLKAFAEKRMPKW